MKKYWTALSTTFPLASGKLPVEETEAKDSVPFCRSYLRLLCVVAFFISAAELNMAGLTSAPVTMAKIDPHSSVTAKEELDLFKTPATETSELSSTYI